MKDAGVALDYVVEIEVDDAEIVEPHVAAAACTWPRAAPIT